MILAAFDWTPVVTGSAAVLGAAVGGVAAVWGQMKVYRVQAEEAVAQRAAERSEAGRSAREAAYLELLTLANEMRSIATGVIAAGPGSAPDNAPEVRAAMVQASARVKFLAPTATWSEMGWLMNCADALANFAMMRNHHTPNSEMMQAVYESVENMKAANPQVWESATQKYLEAARLDLC